MAECFVRADDFYQHWGRPIDVIEAEIDQLRRKLDLARMEARAAESSIRELKAEKSRAQRRQK